MSLSKNPLLKSASPSNAANARHQITAPNVRTVDVSAVTKNVTTALRKELLRDGMSHMLVVLRQLITHLGLAGLGIGDLVIMVVCHKGDGG